LTAERPLGYRRDHAMNATYWYPRPA
jgi:hypothetical protein